MEGATFNWKFSITEWWFLWFYRAKHHELETKQADIEWELRQIMNKAGWYLLTTLRYIAIFSQTFWSVCTQMWLCEEGFFVLHHWLAIFKQNTRVRFYYTASSFLRITCDKGLLKKWLITYKNKAAHAQINTWIVPCGIHDI